MKVLLALLLVLVVSFVAAAPTAEKKAKQTERLRVRTKQRRWLANDLKAYHQQMRKVHKNYIPCYPDAPVLTQISIGTPPVNYSVSMESGSEAIFVLAQNYPSRTANQSFFDPAQSSTAQQAGNYRAFSGNLEAFGSAYVDVVGLFGYGVWENTTQKFGVVNEIVGPYSFYPVMPDGVVGMSWDPEDAANPNENSSAIINLFQEMKQFDKDIERYYCDMLYVFGDPEHGRENTGQTTFGWCLDICGDPTPANTYPLTWLAETRSLAFVVDSFTYKGWQYAGGYGKVDTGVPNILVPYTSLVEIWADVNPDYDYEHFLYTVPCAQRKSLPDWTFTIGGSNYTIRSSDYVVDLLLPDDQCALSVYISDEETTDYVFGYVFHNNWCIKMDIDNQAISIMDVEIWVDRPTLD